MAAITRSTQVLSLTSTSDEFTDAMQVGLRYALISTTACWFKVGVTGGTAAAAANSVYLPADTFVELKAEGSTTGFVQAVRASADGTANLILLEGV